MRRPRHGPAMIVGVGVRQHAGAADEAVGGLQSGDTAQASRAADRAAGVGAEARRHQAGSECGARARRRAAGEVRCVPGIARRRPRQVERRSAVRELVRRELARQHGPGGLQAGDGGRVLVGNAVDAGARMARRQDAGRVVDILEGERNAVQRPAQIAVHDLGLGGAGSRHGDVRRARDEGIQLRVERLGARQQALGVLDRRQLADRDQVGGLGQRQIMQLGRRHGTTPEQVSLPLWGRRDGEAIFERLEGPKDNVRIRTSGATRVRREAIPPSSKPQVSSAGATFGIPAIREAGMSLDQLVDRELAVVLVLVDRARDLTIVVGMVVRFLGVEDLAVHVLRGVRAEVGDHRRHELGSGHRHSCLELRLGQQPGLDAPLPVGDDGIVDRHAGGGERAHGVGRDAVAAALARDRARQADDAGLRRRIVALANRALEGIRGEIDDPAEALAAHQLDGVVATCSTCP